ncbi:DNA translocase FtsK [Candidatus Vallotia cooleyia]|nr:DNA translocase FtsK [Candidatus Vallotia cooleyia]
MAKSTYSTEGKALPHRLSRLLSEMRWILQVALGLFLLMALVSYSRYDPGWTYAVRVDQIKNWGGRIGAWVADVLLLLFGLSTYWWIVLLGRSIADNYWRFTQRGAQDTPTILREGGWLTDILSFALVLLASNGLEALWIPSLKAQLLRVPGGIIGDVIAYGVKNALGFIGGTLTLLLALAIGLSLFFRFSWLATVKWISDTIISAVMTSWLQHNKKHNHKASQEVEVKHEGKIAYSRGRPKKHEPAVVIIPTGSECIEQEKQVGLFQELPRNSMLPPIILLDPPPAMLESVSVDALDFTSRLIEKKLKDFGVEVTVVAAYPGPVITRYEIEPAVGVKGSQVVNLAKDLSRALSLSSIRVVETIPSKNFMGLEVPNRHRQPVRLTEILGSAVYVHSSSLITIGLGKDTSGSPICADLAKMPHLLVAGTTGSGKSVGINAMILSLLYKASAEQVRLIMIDPKMLELSVYQGIPHLLCPVITDMQQAAQTLNWAVAEMERRYKLMSQLGVRNLASYNNKIDDAVQRNEKIYNPCSIMSDAPEPLEKLPHIVVIIDELADLMMVVGKKVEELIARIAQKARAAGIHLILATQRPSVDIITGLIKANIPARIAFQVSSKIDSRTILDQIGAESLLGQGDMLYLTPGTGLPVRIHGAFVSDDEVHRVVKKVKEQGGSNYIDGILEEGG